MCGICGVVQLEGEPRQVVESHVLRHMTDVMTHRGPDDRGTYESAGIALGMRRLSIVDIDGGHQPFVNEAGDVWAIQNGELYNHQAVRKELRARGHRLHSRCDTEVIPHLYEDSGPGFAARLRGIFGIAVWDQARRRAVLVRDRLGVKPLYWARAGDLLVFASELKSLLASGLIGGEIDYDAIDSYLTLGFIPAPRTPLLGVAKLMPGHQLVVEDGGFEIQRYWKHPEPAVALPRMHPDEYAEGLIEVLEEAVRLRLMSDVPLGAMLSGGLDSTLIVALMARNMSQPVKTFSVGFAEDRDSELDDARYAASVFGTEHHELELSFFDDAVDLEELVWSMDEPLADVSALGFEALSRLASRHVTVALSGQGADELLGGYRKHRAAALVGAWMNLPHPVRATGAALARRAPGRFRRAGQTLAAPNPVDRLIEMSGRLGGGLRESLYRGPLHGKTGTAALEAINELAPIVVDQPLSVTLHIDAQLALADLMLHYFDRASMANSLEVRVPFLDHRVVEYCAGIPPDVKVRRLQTKYVLKRGARGIVPSRIIDKRKLGFFVAPSRGWLQAQLTAGALEPVAGSDSRCAEFLDPDEVATLARAHQTGADVSNTQLLTAILMLETWLQSYLPRALAPAPAPSSLACAESSVR